MFSAKDIERLLAVESYLLRIMQLVRFKGNVLSAPPVETCAIHSTVGVDAAIRQYLNGQSFSALAAFEAMLAAVSTRTSVSDTAGCAH